MTIFDGVEINLTPPQQPKSTPTWLSVVQLVVGAFLAAEQCRQERLAAEADRPGTLEQVMAQVGLKIPGLEEMLAQLMGNGEEARIAASMIAGSPDPLGKLQQFAQRFAADAAMNATSPAGESREVPRTGGVSEQPSPPPAAREAEAPALAPWEQPDFERRAREAIRAAEAADSGHARPAANDAMPKFIPEFAPRAAREPVAAPSSAPARPSLVGVVRHQLEALRRRMHDHEAELDTRLGRAEAELAALRDDLRRRTRPNLVVVPSPSDEPTSPDPAEHRPQDAQARPTPVEPPTVDPAASRAERTLATVVPATPAESDGIPQPHAAPTATKRTEGAAASPAAELPSSASDEEIAEALGLVADFGAEADARYQRSLARISAVEQEARILRAELRGETTEPAVQSALS